jgi:hypothetical protein
MQPKPTRAEPKQCERNTFCTSYRQCLDCALKSGWEGFSCAACPLKSRDSGPRAEAFVRRSTSPMEVA